MKLDGCRSAFCVDDLNRQRGKLLAGGQLVDGQRAGHEEPLRIRSGDVEIEIRLCLHRLAETPKPHSSTRVGETGG